MNATDILNKAARHMTDRAATYDKPEGERSMGRAVEAFNAITGRDLSEAEGWLLLQVLKSVRLFTRPGYHADSAEDGVAYAALVAEAKSVEAIDHAMRVASQAADLLVECRDAAEKFIAGAGSTGIPADLEPAVIESSGPMWIEWRGESEVPPVAEGVMVEVRSRDGETEIGLAGYFEWMHGVLPYDHDIVAWREPWPDDDRIDAIGQNGATGEHY